jgi:hypothetical protein
MAEVRLSFVAVDDLDRMIRTHSLLADTRARVAHSLRALEHFPRIGRELEGRWHPFRFVLGPRRWMLVLCVYEERDDAVLIATIQAPARPLRLPRAEGRPKRIHPSGEAPSVEIAGRRAAC